MAPFDFTLPVRPPYRLDLTATVLRRLSTNIVDVYRGGIYRRVLRTAGRIALIEVEQHSASALGVRVEGVPPADVAALLTRMLGTDVDLEAFYGRSARIAWLGPLVAQARGVKPPRYPSVWEAIVNAVVFQQISIHAAAAILRRVIERFEAPLAFGDVMLAPFVSPQAIVDADPLDLRSLGLSINKVVALRTLGRMVLDGLLEEPELAALPTAELVARLQTLRGIGPWTAAVIALRGFGRLDVFPLRDSGVARSLRDLSGEANVDAAAILTTLAGQRGMLYYHLLLGRLAARGAIALGAAGESAAGPAPRMPGSDAECSLLASRDDA